MQARIDDHLIPRIQKWAKERERIVQIPVSLTRAINLILNEKLPITVPEIKSGRKHFDCKSCQTKTPIRDLHYSIFNGQICGRCCSNESDKWENRDYSTRARIAKIFKGVKPYKQ